MKANDFYSMMIKAHDWPKDELCDPPTDPREACHILIDSLLGPTWYVTMPESDDQVITAAVYDILKKKERQVSLEYFFLLDIILLLANILIFCVFS